MNLEPCSCGSNAIWTETKPETPSHAPLGYIECAKNCLRTTGNMSREVAVDTWNARMQGIRFRSPLAH